MALQKNDSRKSVQKFLESRFPDTDWSDVIDSLPPIIWRYRWNTLAEKYGLPYSQGYMENLDCQGCGPSSFV